ncbi:hypothetical protein C1645_827409 [Glomus cerebriforme]|uniref:Uncharacterized protein n=1 Tax=Glomus cerebriforme TaxID=658196 RepID=A0A397ST00_9GLOM|nr:hypothetical protein C1645_827409 [Glomus cerebriforme]
MSSKFLVELSNDYENLFETKLGYDIIIYAGEEPSPEVFKLLIAVDQLNIQSLIFHIQEFLIENQTEFYVKILLDLIHDLLEFYIVPNMKPKTNVASSRKLNLNI